MRVIAVLVVFCMLVACGIKGPLYIPERQYPQNPTPDQQSKDGAKKLQSEKPTQK